METLPPKYIFLSYLLVSIVQIYPNKTETYRNKTKKELSHSPNCVYIKQ